MYQNAVRIIFQSMNENIIKKNDIFEIFNNSALN